MEFVCVFVDIGGGGGMFVIWFRFWELGKIDMCCMCFVFVGLMVFVLSLFICGGVL